jgi:hypothetical protein
MCEYIKTKFPHIYLYTSTNGLAFTEEKVRQLARSGIDEVTFSLDGASQEAYVQYRQRGNFDKAIANLRAMIDERARNGQSAPFVNWRYILFKWNDSDEEMNKCARWPPRSASIACAGDYRSSGGSYWRSAPGSADYERIRHESGTTAPRQRDPWRHTAPKSTSNGAADLPFMTRPSMPVDRARQRVEPSVPCSPIKVTDVIRLYSPTPTASSSIAITRAWLPVDLPGTTGDAHRRHRARKTGRYGLKFDLVSEGIDWFESVARRLLLADCGLIRVPRVPRCLRCLRCLRCQEKHE